MTALPAAMPPATTADIAGLHERLTRYIHGHFRRKLSLDEAGDAASEALVELDRARAAGDAINDLHAWLRRAAWRNAIDAIRKIEGEGKVRRQRPTDLHDHLDRLSDTTATVDQALVDDASSRADAEAVAAALRQLKPDEHRVVQLRYFDGLDVPAVLEIIGASRHHYENIHKRAIHRLRNALVEHAGDESCGECRALVLASSLPGSVNNDDLARRDAHLEACLACRAYARRQRGLLAALPLPALTLLGRLSQRWHAATATIGAPAATALVTTTGTAKVAATVCGVGVLAAGVCTGVKTYENHRDTRPAAQLDATRKRLRPATQGTSTSSSQALGSSHARRDMPGALGRTRTAGTQAKQSSARNSGSASTPTDGKTEFLPDGNTGDHSGEMADRGGASVPLVRTASTSTAMSTTSAPHSSPAPAPAPRAESAGSSSEFAP